MPRLGFSLSDLISSLRVIPATLFLLLLFSSPPGWSANIEGTYRLLKDSNGKTLKAGAVVEITFSSGSFTMKAVQPGATVDDKGSYRLAGNTITISFEEMAQGRQQGPYTLKDGVLTLPFMMLSDGKGSSTWQSVETVAATSPASGKTLSEVLQRTLDEAQTKARGRAKVDQLATLALPDVKGGLAEAYYVQASLFFMKSYYYEAWYGFAKAAQLQPTNGVYLNNLAMVLMELNKHGDALVILKEVTAWFPQLAPPWGNLAVAYWKSGDIAKAEAAVTRAIELSPSTGLYHYLYGKILAKKGGKQEAQKSFDKAWTLGYAGSGREGTPGGAKGNGAGASPTGGGRQDTGASRKTSSPGKTTRTHPPTKDKPFPPEWAGHYEAMYVRARSGENAAEANTQFGKNVTTTNMNLRTLACAKEFSMDISNTGAITGHGKVMYVYQGTAVNHTAALMGSTANLKNGYQIRNWSFAGQVDSDGNVEIAGMPEGKLDLLNVGKWQKISTWSPLPPDGTGAAMRGPFHMKLATGMESGPNMRVDQWLALNDQLIRKVHYEAFIVKSEKELTPDCNYAKPEEATCPASEYIKTKLALTPSEGVTLETSTTFTKGKGGVEQSYENTRKVGADLLSVDTAGRLSTEISAGMFTGSTEFNPTDGSYTATVGIGLNTADVYKEYIAKTTGEYNKELPASISQKIELVYDSKCGWGVKGTMNTKIDKMAAGVEGAIFFNKGI